MNWNNDNNIQLKDRKSLLQNILKNLSPAQGVVYGFALLIMAGTVLLMLPAASRTGEGIGFVDALFTSTSAACVTGLVVVDTYSQWTLLGQLIILSLIQIGGLGIITMATWISVIIGRRVTYKERLFVQESLNQEDVSGIVKLTKRVIFVTFVIEFIGAVLLCIRFMPQFGVIKGIYMGIFHSIAAFCNAGFDLFSNFKSFTSYVTDPFISLTIAGLVILGGIGFIVLEDLRSKKNFKKLMLHSKLAITITLILIIIGTLLFLVMENSNSQTIGNLNFPDKILASFFQSVTCRTAGFNTVPIDGLTEESKLVAVILMFIGASPGSTGGGIKTVTFGVIIFSIISILKGKENTEIFKRTVPQRIVKKSIAIIFFSFTFITIITLLIAMNETIPIVNLVFEVVSAFGTVGLSTGITPELLDISKLLIIITMFIGRVGPLTLTFALARKLDKKKLNYKYPDGKIMVG